MPITKAQRFEQLTSDGKTKSEALRIIIQEEAEGEDFTDEE